MLNLSKNKGMKKALTSVLISIRALVIWVYVTIDRFIMAMFIGVDLPPYRLKRFVVDENTTDEQIEQSVIDEDQHRIWYTKDYIPKARRRSLTAIALYTTYRLFLVLSWTELLVPTATIALVASIYLLWYWLSKNSDKNKNQ